MSTGFSYRGRSGLTVKKKLFKLSCDHLLNEKTKNKTHTKKVSEKELTALRFLLLFFNDGFSPSIYCCCYNVTFPSSIFSFFQFFL